MPSSGLPLAPSFSLISMPSGLFDPTFRNATRCNTTSSSSASGIATTCSEPGVVQVSVADCGGGIEPAVLDHLFDPFVTTKAKGLGLGLSICRSIVTAHGGRLWAANNSGRGATFWVALPAADGARS